MTRSTDNNADKGSASNPACQVCGERKDEHKIKIWKLHQQENMLKSAPKDDNNEGDDSMVVIYNEPPPLLRHRPIVKWDTVRKKFNSLPKGGHMGIPIPSEVPANRFSNYVHAALRKEGAGRVRTAIHANKKYLVLTKVKD